MASNALLQAKIREARRYASQAMKYPEDSGNVVRLANAIHELSDVLDSILIAEHAHPVMINPHTLATFAASLIPEEK